ncbi:MAG: tetratricopeptide repeat protein, partial [Woeseiaceae bacterium]
MSEDKKKTSILGELKRRNVYRVGLAYVVFTWLGLQVIDTLGPILGLPEWTPRLVFTILAIGFPAVILFAWAYELTPEGIKREKDVDRSQSIT